MDFYRGMGSTQMERDLGEDVSPVIRMTRSDFDTVVRDSYDRGYIDGVNTFKHQPATRVETLVGLFLLGGTIAGLFFAGWATAMISLGF